MVLSLLRKLEAFKNDDDIHYTPNIEACQVETLVSFGFRCASDQKISYRMSREIGLLVELLSSRPSALEPILRDIVLAILSRLNKGL